MSKRSLLSPLVDRLERMSALLAGALLGAALGIGIGTAIALSWSSLCG